ncbi:MAG: D-aminoacyl-tRNA deacylase [Candidatus Omnitrophica bacterium]|nr:D-aminoacyl-tRNA deacylase [Candidatus Omnitrophota bacterium]
MKAVIQRVSSACVKTEGKIIAKISKGLVVLIGISCGDTEKKAEITADKICNLRIFEDDNKKMNLSAKDIGADILVVSQFTLLADLDKGRRPSFTEAALPQGAEVIYNKLISNFKKHIPKVEGGKFGAHMQLELINDGPATFVFDTDKN